MGRGLWHALGVTLVLLLIQAIVPGAGVVAAQPAGPGDSAFEGRPIREVRFENISPDNEALARNQIRTVAGQPLRSASVTLDIQNLYRLGRFRTIDSRIELVDDGAVVVIFRFEEAPIIRDVQVTGNERIKSDELAAIVRTIGLRAGAPIDDFRIGKARRAIEDLYRDRGFYTVEVFVDESELRETGVIILRVREGERVRVSAIRFEGGDSFPQKQLRSRVKSKTKGLLRKGPLDEDLLEQDVATLVDFYRSQGFLDIRADRRITISPNGREAIVTFVLDEGPQYTMREVVLRNGDGDFPLVFTVEQVRGLLTLKQGDVYGSQGVIRSRRAIEEAYWRLGYVDVNVRVQELRDTVEPLVDLLITVVEGQAYRTGEVIIEGNSLTRQNVIRKAIQVRPDMPLDRAALEDSRRRLITSRLFDTQRKPPRLTIQPERPDEPGYRDVLVEVEETNTGAFSFGAAVNSDAGLIGSVSLSQSNFDISDTPESVGELFSGKSFRGGGQTMSLSLSPGTQIQTYALSWSDPTVLDTDNSLSLSGSYRDRIFDQYDEERLGVRNSIGRRLGDRWSGSMSIRHDAVELSDIDSDAPVDVFEVADRNQFTGVGLRLSRTTVPPGEGRSPSRGIRTTLSVEQVFGDFDFTKLGFNQDLFFTVAEDALGRRSKVSLSLNTNYIPQKGEAPIYERYFLGGQSFRGFDFREVSPKGIRADTGTQGKDPVGGQWLFFAGAEYEIPLVGELAVAPGITDPLLSGVVFLDTGTVLDDVGFEDYRVSAGFGIRIRVPQLGPAPLAFDFGFPIKKEDDDDERLFSFSLDLPF